MRRRERRDDGHCADANSDTDGYSDCDRHCNCNCHGDRDGHRDGDCTATPTATPASQTLNLSTRMRTGCRQQRRHRWFHYYGNVPKRVIIRALGPSLTKFGVSPAEALADPILEVHGPGAFGTITNNNWRDSQEAQIAAAALRQPTISNLRSTSPCHPAPTPRW